MQQTISRGVHGRVGGDVDIHLDMIEEKMK